MTRILRFSQGPLRKNPPSKGDLVKGDVRPYGQLYILEIRRGAGDKVIGR